jgi:hypothetical protein
MKKAILLLGLFIVMIACKDDFPSVSVPGEQGEPMLKSASTTAVVLEIGKTISFDLIAGQKMLAGSVEFRLADASNLYVTYKTTGDWCLNEIHFWIGTDPNGYPQVPNENGNPQIGHFPYKFEKLGCVSSYTFKVVGSWCDQTFYFISHAAVNGETAYAGESIGAPNWTLRGSFTVDCTTPPPPPTECWQYETAWAAGKRYVNRGNWATYTAYVSGGTSKVFAGQTMEAGKVWMSPVVNGLVTLKIILSTDWYFDDVSENVKVQDYAVAPSVNPAPGLFAWKMTASDQYAEIVVPANSLYGIHMDVKKKVKCQ